MRPQVSIRVVTLVNPECGKMVNFSDNQSPFSDGLLMPHTGAGKILDVLFLKGRSPTQWGALKTNHLSSVPGAIPDDGIGL